MLHLIQTVNAKPTHDKIQAETGITSNFVFHSC